QGEVLFLSTFDMVERGEPDEAAGPVHLVHNGIAGVNACRAVHTLHLCAITDVDASGTDGDALMAVNAIAQADGLTRFDGLAATERGAFVAALKVVGDQHGILIEHRRLQAAVRTDEGTRLFSEAGKDGIENQRAPCVYCSGDDSVPRKQAKAKENLEFRLLI